MRGQQPSAAELSFWNTSESSSTSLKIRPNGHPALCYYSSLYGGSLQFREFDGAQWNSARPDDYGAGSFCSMGIDADDRYWISYYDEDNGDLKIAWSDGADWRNQVVDAEGDVGRFTSLAIGPDDRPAISYYDVTNSDLKFARFDGAEWSIETVHGTGSVGEYSSLAFGPDGKPAISYYDHSNRDLLFARIQ